MNRNDIDSCRKDECQAYADGTKIVHYIIDDNKQSIIAAGSDQAKNAFSNGNHIIFTAKPN